MGDYDSSILSGSKMSKTEKILEKDSYTQEDVKYLRDQYTQAQQNINYLRGTKGTGSTDTWREETVPVIEKNEELIQKIESALKRKVETES